MNATVNDDSPAIRTGEKCERIVNTGDKGHVVKKSWGGAGDESLQHPSAGQWV